MNRNVLNGILLIVLTLALLGGFFYYFGKKSTREASGTRQEEQLPGENGGEDQSQEESSDEVSTIQEELERTSSQLVADMRAESRLNLNMLGQLRAYGQMLHQLQLIAKDVDKNIGILEEITHDEFQENVRLQASLFKGKKADMVAKHLEEFTASRVGAILSKMRDQEASAVMDIWAKQKEPRYSTFYREVMAAYLNNKRYETRPELFVKPVSEKPVADE